MKKYKLPPLDLEKFAVALEAYRAAVEYERRIDRKWEPQQKAIRKADEFSDLNRDYENDTYVAEKLRTFARDLLVFSATRSRPYPEHVYSGKSMDLDLFEGGTPEFQKVLGKVRAAFEICDRMKIRNEL